VPRFLSLIALVLAFVMMGAPTWIAALTGDDCAEKCRGEAECPDEGCADCSIICSACPRTHVVVPQQATRVAPASIVSWLSREVGERMPVGPPQDGVFHPPRRAG
jgi:hypothetical protein